MSDTGDTVHNVGCTLIMLAVPVAVVLGLAWRLFCWIAGIGGGY